MRYLPTELQDKDGNVIYPHTEAGVVWLSDGTHMENALNEAVTDEDIESIFSTVINA